MPAGERIGLYGGAFDPPHAAHVAVAKAALEQLSLDRLLVLPTGSAWHKARPLTPGHHRVAMAQLAFDGLPQVTVDAREMCRAGPSYTIDTLRELALHSPVARWFLVIGDDQARAFQQWKEWQAILGLASVAVAPRLEPEFAEGPTGALSAVAGPASSADLRPERWAGQTVTRLSLPSLPHSATAIRARLAAGEPAAVLAPALLPDAVARYIDQHRLYLTT